MMNDDWKSADLETRYFRATAKHPELRLLRGPWTHGRGWRWFFPAPNGFVRQHEVRGIDSTIVFAQ